MRCEFEGEESSPCQTPALWDISYTFFPPFDPTPQKIHQAFCTDHRNITEQALKEDPAKQEIVIYLLSEFSES